jgi:hypothetical protein
MVLSVCLVGYNCGRFWLEFARGDVQRSYFLGFSQAQWTSQILPFAMFAGAQAGLLPGDRWLLTGLIFVSCSFATVIIMRRVDERSRFALEHPRHVREFAGALSLLNAAENDVDRYLPANAIANETNLIHVAETSLGIRVSTSIIDDGRSLRRQYTLSRTDGLLKRAAAKRLATLIVRLTHRSSSAELLCAGSGVFHVMVEPHIV